MHYQSKFLLEFPQSNESAKVSKGAKIRNQYNQVPHLTQDTNDAQAETHQQSYFHHFKMYS